MLRVIVVDDERLARQGMRSLLKQFATVELVGEADSVKSASDLIKRQKPDAVFLDIEMQTASGFDLIRTLADPPDIVFVTAHNHYAIKAYDAAAMDYLLKPVHPKRLASAVKRLEKAQRLRRSADGSRRRDGASVLAVKTRSKTVVLRTQSIIALCAEGDYTSVIVDHAPPILASSLLGKIAVQLPGPPFIRLSRSLIINGARLREIEHLSRDSTRVWLHGYSGSFKLGRGAAAKVKQIFHTNSGQ